MSPWHIILSLFGISLLGIFWFLVWYFKSGWRMQGTSAREHLTRPVNHLRRIMTNRIIMLIHDLQHSCRQDRQIYEGVADQVLIWCLWCFAGGILLAAFVIGIVLGAL